MRYPNFIDGSNELSSTAADLQRTINLMPEIAGEAAKNRVVLNGTPGLQNLGAVAGSNAVRGMFLGDLANTDYFHAAIDAKLYKFLTTDGTYTEVGSIADDSAHSPIHWATGGVGQDTLIVASGTAYSLKSGVLEVITDLAGVTCIGASYLGGYWITATANGVFRISGVGDVSSWDPLDYDYADPQVEEIVGHIVSNGQIWFMGKTRTNIWYLDDSTDFGLSPIRGVRIERGASSPDAICVVDNAVTWLASLEHGVAQVVVSRSYSPQRISTHFVEAVLAANAPSLSSAWAVPLEEKGHEVFMLSLPAAETSLCYDASTGRWHERAAWNGSAYSPHFAKCHLVKNGVHYTGSRSSGQICKMASDYYTDAGSAIRRLRRAPHLHKESAPLSYFSFELDIDRCLGPDQSDPLMYLRYSDDGGKTWSAPLAVSMGETDDAYEAIRLQWNRLGTGRDRVFEVYSTAAVKHCWTDAYLEVG